MQSLAIPLRLQENGLLRREDGTRSLLAFLDAMARTPQGSWKACPVFGLRDLFEGVRQRADLARLALDRINDSFKDLGMTDYVATEVIRELSGNRETDTYSITLEHTATAERITTSFAQEF